MSDSQSLGSLHSIVVERTVPLKKFSVGTWKVTSFVLSSAVRKSEFLEALDDITISLSIFTKFNFMLIKFSAFYSAAKLFVTLTTISKVCISSPLTVKFVVFGTAMKCG